MDGDDHELAGQSVELDLRLSGPRFALELVQLKRPVSSLSGEHNRVLSNVITQYRANHWGWRGERGCLPRQDPQYSPPRSDLFVNWG
jgi:hypothetical protein